MDNCLLKTCECKILDAKDAEIKRLQVALVTIRDVCCGAHQCKAEASSALAHEERLTTLAGKETI
jgi:hypothetical protein